MRGKKGMSISIVVLVLSTLFLSSYCLIAFNLRQTKLKYIVSNSKLGDIYAIEEVLNYNIRNIMEDSVAGTKEEFIQNFRNNLAEYRKNGGLPQLAQVDSQLTEENVKITEQGTELTLTLELEGDVSEDVHASYTYTKTFIKQR